MKAPWIIAAALAMVTSALLGYCLRPNADGMRQTDNRRAEDREPRFDNRTPRLLPALDALPLRERALDPAVRPVALADMPPAPAAVPPAVPVPKVVVEGPPAPPPSPPKTPQITKVVEFDADGTAYEWVPFSTPTKLRNSTCVATVTNLTAGETITLVRKDTGIPSPAVKTPATAGATPTVDVRVDNLDLGGYQLAAQASDGTNPSLKSGLSVELIQLPTTDLLDPALRDVGNNPNLPTVAANGLTALAIHDGYLFLSGTRGTHGGQIRFVVEDDVAKVQRELPAVSPVNDDGSWTATLNLTQLPTTLAAGKTHHLWVRSEAEGKHRYALTALPFSVAASDPELTKPTGLALLSERGQALVPDPTTHKYWASATKYQVQLTVANPSTFADTAALVYDASSTPPKLVGQAALTPTGTAVVVGVSGEGPHRLAARLQRGNTPGPMSDPLDLTIHANGLRVQSVQPTNFGTAPGVQALTLQFTPGNRLSRTEAENPANYVLRRSMGTGVFDRGTDKDVTTEFATTDKPSFDEVTNTVVLKFKDLAVDIYQLEIKSAAVQPDGTLGAGGLRDVYGNVLQDANGNQLLSYKVILGKPTGTDSNATPSELRGISGQTGPYVVFPEYTPLRTPPAGINPSDKVETRVARLYYFRDAHRVAQIINRNVKSFNYQAVEVSRRLADKARDEANRLTDERRQQEEKARQSAQDARAAEKQLVQEQAALQQARQKAAKDGQEVTAADQRISQLKSTTPEVESAQQAAQARVTQLQQTGGSPADLAVAQKQLAQCTDSLNNRNTQLGLLTDQLGQLAKSAAAATTDVQTAEGRVQAALSAVQVAHNAEVAENQRTQVLAAQEDRSKEEQFRREVAAAATDPDTYAPGVPGSQDPVQQCSIAVIGEGEIQLRGPVKGMNVIRTMINQIDAPVGQVRVAIHTAQVNGEHDDRMEKVVDRIQKYIDHSRFLTAQSGQLLRKAVVVVASRHAEQVVATCPAGSQTERDNRYLHSFFGDDFIRELETLDSEFLHTGNKLLSLHSMDSTSLSSALFLMALAKNSVRQEIMDVFKEMLDHDLPAAEMAYFEAGGGLPDCKKFPILANNARFQSLRGYFDAWVSGDDTMTPIQREFIKLAQIFKSRLITELEYKQRVMERTIIEERFGKTYEEQIKDQLAREAYANARLGSAQEALDMQGPKIVQALASVQSQLQGLGDEGADLESQVQEEDYSPKLAVYIRKIADIPGAPAFMASLGIELDPSHPLDSPFNHITKHATEIYPKVLGKQDGLTPAEATTRASILKAIETRPIYQFKEKIDVLIKTDAVGLPYWVFKEEEDRKTWNGWVDRGLAAMKDFEWIVPPENLKARYDDAKSQLLPLKVSGDDRHYPVHGMTAINNFFRVVGEIVRARSIDGKQLLEMSRKLLADSRRNVKDLDATFYADWMKLRDRCLAIYADDKHPAVERDLHFPRLAYNAPY